MKKNLAFMTWMPVFISLACLNAPRDNIYDPKNPDRARIIGTLYEPDSMPIEEAVISLILGDTIALSSISNSNGEYVIEEIVPDVYRIRVEAPAYYDTISFYPESLWAEIDASNVDFYFTTLTFTNNTIGTQEPYAFNIVEGLWSIVHDTANSMLHSIPAVYEAIDTTSTGAAVTLYRSTGKNFEYRVKFNVQSFSTFKWQAGIVFRYQDQNNYYLLAASPDTLGFYRIRNSVIERYHCILCTFQNGQWYSIGVMYNGSILNVLINEVVQFQLSENFYKDGYFGLWASNQDTLGQRIKVIFDDVFVLLL